MGRHTQHTNYDFPIFVNGSLSVSAAADHGHRGVGNCNSSYGQSVSFTVTVSPPSNGPTPTGSVQFQINGINFGSTVMLVDGAATSSAIFSAHGDHTRG